MLRATAVRGAVTGSVTIKTAQKNSEPDISSYLTDVSGMHAMRGHNAAHSAAASKKNTGASQLAIRRKTRNRPHAPITSMAVVPMGPTKRPQSISNGTMSGLRPSFRTPAGERTSI